MRGTHILTHGCPIKGCSRRFTTETYVKWHIRSSHKINEINLNGRAIKPIKIKPIRVTLNKSPAAKGISIARCPKHKLIALGTIKRHTSCYNTLFRCHRGCVFCKQCEVYVPARANQDFQGGLLKVWKDESGLEFS